LVRIPACHAGGRGFEPRPLRQIKRLVRKNGAFLFLRSKNMRSGGSRLRGSRRGEKGIACKRFRGLRLCRRAPSAPPNKTPRSQERGVFVFCAAKSFTPLIISHPLALFVSPDKITRHVSNKCEFQVLFRTEMFTLKRNLQFLKKQETGTAGANNVFEGTRPVQTGRGRRAQAAPQRCEENPRDALRIRKVVQGHGHAGQSTTTRGKVVQPGPARGHQMG
jgi:hypothetical protein